MKKKTLTLDNKIVIANIVAEVLRPKAAYIEFSSKPKEVQYGILFNQEVNGITLVAHYGEDDGPHIVGLVRYRLNNPATANVAIELP